VDIEEGALARLLAVGVSQSIGAIMIELAKHKIPFGHLGWKTDLSNNNVSLFRKARVLMLAVATSAEKTEREVANRVAALAAPVDDSAAAAGAAASKVLTISSLGRRLQKMKNKLPEVDAATHKPPKD
jgi:hypothetical protein